MDDFREECRKARLHNEWLKEQREKDIHFVGDQCYSLFCAWCNAYRPEILPGTTSQLDFAKMRTTSYVNPQFFREFCDEQKTFGRQIPDYQIKKFIAEKYFGYEYFTDVDGNEKMRKRQANN